MTTIDERLADLATRYAEAKRQNLLARVAVLGPRIDALLDWRLSSGSGDTPLVPVHTSEE